MRKLFLFIIPLLLLTVFFSCKDSIRPPALSEAQTLLNSNPDSALQILTSLDTNTLNDDEKMLRRLLIMSAKDMLSLSNPDTLLTNMFVKYFIVDKKFKTIHPLIYYYCGRAHLEQGSHTKALIFFKKALRSISPKGDIFLERRIHGQLADLYWENGIKKHSLRELKLYYKLSDSIASLYPSPINRIDRNWAYLNLAQGYDHLNYPDSASRIYNILQPEIESANDSNLISSFILTYADHFIRNNKYSQADSILSNKTLPFNRSSWEYVTNTRSRIEMSKPNPTINEKALLEVVDSGNLLSKVNAVKILAEYAKYNNDGAKLLKYSIILSDLFYKLQNITNEASLVEMERIIDNTEIENENQRLQEESGYRLQVIIIVVCVTVILIFIVTLFLLYNKARYTKLKYEAEKMKALNRNHIIELKNEILSLQQQVNSLEQNDKVITLENHINLAKIVDEFSKRLLSSKEAPTEEDFIHLKAALKLTNPSFIAALDEMDLKPRDFQDALLLKIDTPQKICAEFFGITPQALSNQHSRLFRLYAKGSDRKNWKGFLNSL